MGKCLYCYKELNEGEKDFHAKCARKMFSNAEAPLLPYTRENLTEFKYKGSYEQIAKIIVKYSSAPFLDLANFWEQVLFSWITGNSDMHLKNFSLYSKRKGEYILTPAYDFLSTLLVMPEDTEELALTLNGKKRKLKKADFMTAMSSSGLDEKVIENIFVKFKKAQESWMEFISISFIPDAMKQCYKDFINKRLSAL